MKKIILSMMAVAALAACSKSEIAYEQTDEIGFQVVSGKMTKAAVQGTTYPDLNMYVFAMTATETVDENDLVTSTTPNATPNFLNNAEFTKKSVADGKNLWGGTPTAYYWPNVEKLCFAGISKSGNVNAGVVPTYSNGVITVDGYVQDPDNTNNDLMWFPTTAAAYGKGTKYVPVDMFHACSWLTIKLEGDTYTAANYKVTEIWIEGLSTKGKAELGTTAKWTLQNEDQTFDVLTSTDGVALPTAGNATAENFENTPNNTIVIPHQVPGDLYITYKFKTQADVELSETVTGSLEFDDKKTPWQPGVHYTYTVKITANEILIQPDLTEWTTPASGDFDVEVQ